MMPGGRIRMMVTRNEGASAPDLNGRLGDRDDERLQQIIDDARDDAVTGQEVVLVAVRRAILNGVFEPGARLRQEELAEVFGTSRIPIREALRALEFEGLVTSEPHRGFAVAALQADDVEEVYDLRSRTRISTNLRCSSKQCNQRRRPTTSWSRENFFIGGCTPSQDARALLD
jgi:DNA-binding transcriptional regulator YhcF (GntR family)